MYIITKTTHKNELNIIYIYTLICKLYLKLLINKIDVMNKVNQLANELYNEKILEGWKNVSMENCIKRAEDYYRINERLKNK